MRLVQDSALALDQDVNDNLTAWKVPSDSFDATHKVTLRGLLSMTGGIGVPGFLGYEAALQSPRSHRFSTARPPPTRRRSR